MKINSEFRADYPKGKLEVISYANEIRNITQNNAQLRNYSDQYSLGEINKISFIAKNIIEKEYEKVKMPIVFDIWYKHQMIESSVIAFKKPKIYLIASLSKLLFDDLERAPYESLLRDWIFEGDEYEHVAFKKCVDAINNGYEVEE